QLERTAQGARRIGARIFDPDASLFEDRMIRPKGKAELPPSHQVAHIEVETLAHDLEGNPASLAEGGEVPECVVHLDMVVDEPDEVHLFRMKQGEVSCY